MSDYATAWDGLCRAIGAAHPDGPRAGYFDDQQHLSVDQQLKAAEIAALLSISQELSKIHHGGINSEYISD